LTETQLNLLYEEKPVIGGKSFTANKRDDSLLVHAPRFSKDLCVLEGSQVFFPVCPSGKNHRAHEDESGTLVE